MQKVDLDWIAGPDGRVWLSRDKLCLWLFEAADEAVACGLNPEAEFCIKSIAELLIQFPNHQSENA